MPVTGDPAQIGRLMAKLAKVTGATARVAVAFAPQAASFLRQEFAQGTDPWGSPWKALRASTLKKGRHPPPLTASGAAASGLAVVPTGTRDRVTLAGYIRFHLNSRPVLPLRGDAWPAPWLAAVKAGAAKALTDIARGDLMLADAIASVRARFASLTPPITAPILMGRRNLPQQGDGLARIVVIPTEDTFGATWGLNEKPRALLTRTAGAEVHVWGPPSSPDSGTADDESIAAVEALLHAFIRELRHETHGQKSGPAVRGGRWNNDTTDVVYGAEYVLSIAVDVPVTALSRGGPLSPVAFSGNAAVGSHTPEHE